LLMLMRMANQMRVSQAGLYSRQSRHVSTPAQHATAQHGTTELQWVLNPCKLISSSHIPRASNIGMSVWFVLGRLVQVMH
jgi:hypothetical protein